MAGLNNRILRFGAVPTWPRVLALRLFLYIILSIIAWLFPPWGALVALVSALVLGYKLKWLSWSVGLGWFWLFILAPLLMLAGGFGIEMALAGVQGLVLPTMPQNSVWLEAGARCLSLLALMAASQWLSTGTTIFEIRSALEFLFRPFGKRIAARLSLIGALALGFVPWVLDQVDAIREAALLRGVRSNQPVRYLFAVSLPLFVRVLEKARQTADALELRGG